MIKLTIQTGFTDEVRLFDQSSILIGSSQRPEVSVCLNHPAIQPIHLKILNQHGKWILVNAVNDPFVEVNGFPFGKKQLTSGDKIELSGTSIVFEETEDVKEIPPEPLTSNVLLDRLEKKIGSSPAFSAPPPPEEVIRDDWSVEEIADELGFDMQPVKESAPARTSLKDSHIGDTGEEKAWYPENNVNKEAVTAQPPPFQKWFIVVVILFLASVAIWGTWEYLIYSRKATKEEIQVTKGLADIAMALTHAQIHHHQPQNHSWTDDDFLKTHLTATVPDPHHLMALGDIQHFFYQHSYTLRVYTSNDLSQFLLIAQPISNFWHWLIPHSTIVIDSLSMEIRKTEDLRPLNRILAHAGPLGQEDMDEISHLIKHARLVPLAKLARALKTSDFIPPPTLAEAYPGAEHRIYNAPRYHRLGKPLLSAMEKIHLNQGAASDIDFIKQEAKALSTLPNIILYTTKDKKDTHLIKKGLKAFAPKDSSLQVGWLDLNEQKDIACCGLAASVDTLGAPTDLQANQLHERFEALQKDRKETLAQVSKELTSLIKAETEKPFENFHHHFTLLSKEFILLSDKENSLMKQDVKALYDELQGKISLLEFVAIAKEVGIEEFLLPHYSDKEIGDAEVKKEHFHQLLNRQWQLMPKAASNHPLY